MSNADLLVLCALRHLEVALGAVGLAIAAAHLAPVLAAAPVDARTAADWDVLDVEHTYLTTATVQVGACVIWGEKTRCMLLIISIYQKYVLLSLACQS